MTAIVLRATAVCLGGCGQLADGSWEACDKAAERHTAVGHATATRVVVVK